MILPNFLIIGAEKAGTTSLYYYLKQHPQIYMSPIKEPRYFAPEFYERLNRQKDKLKFRSKSPRLSPLSFEEYCTLFDRVSNELAIGEASTNYLTQPKAPQRIKQIIPDVKLIAILRNPIERAFSAFCYNYRDGIEERNFSEAIQTGDYIVQGFYYTHLQRYFDIFDPSQIKIYFNEDLSENPKFIVEDIFEFLSVDSTFKPDFPRLNVSGIPKSRFIHNLMNKKNLVKATSKILLPNPKLRQNLRLAVSKLNLSAKPSLPLNLKEELVQTYQEDILKLEKAIGRNLSHWLL